MRMKVYFFLKLYFFNHAFYVKAYLGRRVKQLLLCIGTVSN